MLSWLENGTQSYEKTASSSNHCLQQIDIARDGGVFVKENSVYDRDDRL